MSLTTRLVLFAQVTLGVVLLGFSVLLYVLAHSYLHWQVREQVETAANTLVASVDIEADSVEWEPTDREVKLATGPLGQPVYWYITDARGKAVDRSRLPGTEELQDERGKDPLAAPQRGNGWMVVRHLVHPPGKTGDQLTRERTTEEVQKGEHPALVFTVGIRLDSIHKVLRLLAVGLAGLGVVVWLLGLAAGRWVCRRALRPVTEMAEAARTMRANDFSGRLARPHTKGELEELNQAINDLLDRLASAFERERRFTGEASHQLRTPLGTILGQVEVALRRQRSPEEYERILGIVHRQATHLSRTIEGLLFLARADAPAGTLNLERINLASALDDYLNTLADDPRRGDIVSDIVKKESCLIDAHPALLRELLHNLIDNALKYSTPGTAVRLGVVGDPDGVVLQVEDAGSGVSSEEMPHLFEPFFRSTRVVRGIPGSGLGLTVAARITLAFKGNITATSREGGGIVFTVTLPAALDRPSEDKENLIPTSRWQ